MEVFGHSLECEDVLKNFSGMTAVSATMKLMGFRVPTPRPHHLRDALTGIANLRGPLALARILVQLVIDAHGDYLAR